MLSLRVLTEEDYPLLLDWLSRPHVKAWWDDGDDTLDKVARHYSRQTPSNQRFILLDHAESAGDGRPIGYMQYEVDAAGIASIDQFIGEEILLGRGIGTLAIKLLLAYLVTLHQPIMVTVDPSPDNGRAIHCYEKVGFRHDATLPSPPGQTASMMKIEY